MFCFFSLHFLRNIYVFFFINYAIIYIIYLKTNLTLLTLFKFIYILLKLKKLKLKLTTYFMLRIKINRKNSTLQKMLNCFYCLIVCKVLLFNVSQLKHDVGLINNIHNILGSEFFFF